MKTVLRILIAVVLVLAAIGGSAGVAVAEHDASGGESACDFADGDDTDAPDSNATGADGDRANGTVSESGAHC